jgi:proteasome accessory factor A
MQRRPIINTRDEPHANPQRWRRFHVILGDANMSPFATRLKVGTTALVLEAIVRRPAHGFPQLADPLAALHGISRDPRFRWEVSLQDGTPSTAIAVQRHYLAAVQRTCDLSVPAKAALVADWEQVLADLETDVRRCRDRLDWVAKWALVREFQSAQGLADDDPWLQSLDLEYHRLDLAEGLYYAWEQTGAMLGTPDERAVERAMVEPPATTRAAIRGLCVRKFPAAVLSAQWGHVTLQGSRGPVKVSLLDVFDPAEVERHLRAAQAARSPDDLRRV